MDEDEALTLLKELKGYGTYLLSDIYGTQEVLYDARTQDDYLRRLAQLLQINIDKQRLDSSDGIKQLLTLAST